MSKELNKYKELLEELESYELESKEYLEEWLNNDEEAKEYYPTIDDYDDVVAQLGDIFYQRIWDLACYSVCKRLRIKYGKEDILER